MMKNWKKNQLTIYSMFVKLSQFDLVVESFIWIASILWQKGDEII